MNDTWNASQLYAMSDSWTGYEDRNSSTTGIPMVRSSSPTTQSFSEIHFYGVALVIAVGSVCNVISFVVLVGTRMRNTTSGIYLAALSASDTLVLFAEFVKWLSTRSLGLLLLQRSEVLCKFVYHLRFTTKLWSALLVTTVTLERYLLVSYPLKVNRFANKKLARSLVLAEFLFCAVAGSYGSYFFRLVGRPGETICLIRMATASVYAKYDLVISKMLGEAIPNLAVGVLTVGIIVRLARSRRKRGQMAGSQAEGSAVADRHLTIMLVVLATAFVVLRSPYTITWYISHFAPSSSRRGAFQKSNVMDDALLLTYVVATLNYAVNFFLYCIAGKKFRMHLVKLCCCCCYRPGNDRRSTYLDKSTTISTVSKEVTSRM